MELAVSVPPAPLPIIVWVPECSDVNAMAFNVPLTHNGSSFEISFGLTISSLLHDAINFIEELFRLANKFIFVVIACYPAKKKLPDGRNVHLSIKTIDDWKKIILKIKVKYPHVSPYIICATARKKFVAVS